jgi:hypothetical protein
MSSTTKMAASHHVADSWTAVISCWANRTIWRTVALSKAKRGQGAGAALAWRMEGAGLPQKDQKKGVAPLLLPLHRLPLPMVVILIPTCKRNTLFSKYLCLLLGNLSHTDNALLPLFQALRFYTSKE